VAIVTGGSRGIGRETVRELLQAGVKVMTCSRHPEQVEASCRELASQTSGEVRSIAADMTKPRDTQKLIEASLKLMAQWTSS
jgi:3-oxoacyl-[acyl-carrier protein] reductase